MQPQALGTLLLFWQQKWSGIWDFLPWMCHLKWSGNQNKSQCPVLSFPSFLILPHIKPDLFHSLRSFWKSLLQPSWPDTRFVFQLLPPTHPSWHGSSNVCLSPPSELQAYTRLPLWVALTLSISCWSVRCSPGKRERFWDFKSENPAFLLPLSLGPPVWTWANHLAPLLSIWSIMNKSD